MYSSASACHSDSPGSLFWMWYQSISTGSSATDGCGGRGRRMPRRSGRLDGAALGLDPEHAAVMIATTAIVAGEPSVSQGWPPLMNDDAGRPPASDDTSPPVVAASGAARCGIDRRPRPPPEEEAESCAIVGRSARPRRDAWEPVGGVASSSASKVSKPAATVSTSGPYGAGTRRQGDSTRSAKRYRSVGVRCRGHGERNFRNGIRIRYTPAMVDGSEPSATAARRGTTIAYIAAQTGVSVPTVSKVINGRADVSAATRRSVEAAIRQHGYVRSEGRARSSRLIELIFHELESEWALELVRGVERVAGQHELAVVISEMEGRRTPGRGWIEGVLARRPGRRHRGLRRIERVGPDPARGAWHPARDRGPDRRTAPRHAVDRGDELERGTDGDAPPAVPGSRADRGHRRPVRDPVQPGAAWTGSARPWTPPASRIAARA